MSATPQRGRRRAEPASRPSVRSLVAPRTGTRAATGRNHTVLTTATKGLAAVAVVGALVAAGSVASHSGNGAGLDAANSADTLVSMAESAAPEAISAPSDAAISFSGVTVSSKASPKPTTAVKAEADAVKPVSEKSATPPTHTGPVDDPAAAKAFASSQLESFGWGADQMNCLTLLWQRESEWLTSAENASSGAYGIAQSLPANKMESVGSDWATNFQTQIRWGMTYIQGRYGSPCGAWGHSESVGWY